MPEELSPTMVPLYNVPDPGLGATVGDFIVGVVRKELMTTDVRRQRVRGRVQFMDECPGEDMLESMAVSLPRDILDAAAGWIPALAGLSPATLLPDLDRFPHLVQDAEGLTTLQRKLLVESLEIILDDFQRPGGLPSDADEEDADNGPPLLLPVSIACIAAQIAAALEHVVLTKSKGAPAQLREPDMDLNHWQQVASAKDKVANGREELIEELQKCRQEAFDLEAKMQSLKSSHDGILANERKDAKAVVEKLLSINGILENKLRKRTEETRSQSRRIGELQAKLDHVRWQADKTSAKREELEREAIRWQRMREDIFVREREYGRRLIRFRIEELQVFLRNNQRTKHLRDMLDGKTAAADIHVENCEPTVEFGKVATQTISDLERDFDKLLEQRHEQFQELVVRKERCLQRHFGDLAPELCEGVPGSIAPETTNSATQTERWLADAAGARRRGTGRPGNLEGIDLSMEEVEPQADISPTDGLEASLPDSPTSVGFSDTSMSTPRSGKTSRNEKHRLTASNVTRMVKHNKALDSESLEPLRKRMTVNRMAEAPGRFIRQMNDDAAMKRRATCVTNASDASKGGKSKNVAFNSLPPIADGRRFSGGASPTEQLSVESTQSQRFMEEEEELADGDEKALEDGHEISPTSNLDVDDDDEGLEGEMLGEQQQPQQQAQRGGGSFRHMLAPAPSMGAAVRCGTGSAELPWRPQRPAVGFTPSGSERSRRESV